MATGLLDQEMAVYESHKAELLQNAKGKFVLIKGDRIIDIFENPIDAAKRGFQDYGNVPLLVKQVLEIDLPANFTSL